MLMPIEYMSLEVTIGEGVVLEVVMVVEGANPEGAPTKIPAEVPKYPQMPKLRPNPTTKDPKIKKGK